MVASASTVAGCLVPKKTVRKRRRGEKPERGDWPVVCLLTGAALEKEEEEEEEAERIKSTSVRLD